MADCIDAQITHESAVQRNTPKKQARAWRRWGGYNKIIGNGNLFLKSFSWHQQIKLIGAFALALREGQFSGPAYDKLAESRVTGTLQYVCVTFRKNGYPNLFLDEDARSGFILQQLYRAYRNADPAEKHQKSIPMCVMAKMGKNTILNSLLQCSNLHASDSYLHVNHANISKSQHWSKDKQQSFALETSDSFKMENSSTTTTQN
jgi:hypothetical protein